MKIVLASKSSRRIELLKNIVKEFCVLPSEIGENVIEGESPEEYVCRLASDKASAVVSKMSEDDIWILGADTIVVLGDRIIEKPRSRTEAREMLTQLQGRAHEVITGFCLRNYQGTQISSGAIKTKVKMRKATKDEIDEYVRTGEPLDKAGAYAIQGLGGVFIDSIEGSYSNVVGLPIEEVTKAFIQLGILKEDAGSNER